MPLWVTVYDFKNEYKDIIGGKDDDFIARAMQAAQDAIEGPGDGINRRVLATADTTEYFDANGWEVDGRDLWVIDRGDLSAITTVTNGDGAAVTTAKYTLYPKTLSASRRTIERIRLLPDSGISWTAGTNNPENAISVAGKWGLYATAAAVPDNLKVALMQLTSFILESRKSQVFDTVAVPDAGIITVPTGWARTVEGLLRGYRRHATASVYV